MIYIIPTVVASTFIYGFIQKSKGERISIDKSIKLEKHLVATLSEELEERFHTNKISYADFFKFQEDIGRDQNELVVYARLFTSRFRRKFGLSAFERDIENLVKSYQFFVFECLEEAKKSKRELGDIIFKELVNAYSHQSIFKVSAVLEGLIGTLN